MGCTESKQKMHISNNDSEADKVYKLAFNNAIDNGNHIGAGAVGSKAKTKFRIEKAKNENPHSISYRYSKF